jgi:hypothetical protein
VTVRSKTWVYGRLIAGIEGPNPSEDRNVRLLCLLCCVGSALCDDLIIRLNESSEVCACVSNACDLEISTMRRPRPELGCCASGKKKSLLRYQNIYPVS